MFSVNITLTKTTENTIILTKRLALRLNSRLCMGCKLKTTAFSIITICLLVITACSVKEAPPTASVEESQPLQNASRLEYYPHYETIYLPSGKGYEFRNPKSNKLIITLDGGPSWEAQIGKEDKKIAGWRLVDNLLFLYTVHCYNIFVPEIFDWEEDEINFYWNFTEERERNTFDNVQNCYVEVIEEYISQNNYQTIIIVGFSAGARYLPMVYSRLEALNISALISIAGGGLATYEIYEIMLAKQQAGEAPYEDKENWVILAAGIRLKALLALYREEPRNDSIDRFWGRDPLTYRWLNSIMDKRPFDYYKNIDIPVLFLHGGRDGNVSIESTKYVEDNLPDKPFDYIYYPEMAHGPATGEELDRLRNDIANWLREKGL
jgi:pimeloyl-ACP methyl ester carboxylesterase